MRKELVSIIIFLYVCCSCSKTSNFKENAELLTGESLITDCMIGIPSQILYFEPNNLLLVDRYENKLMTLINTSSNSCVRFLQEGNGPNEVLPGFRAFMSPENNALGLYMSRTGILDQYDLNSIRTSSQVNKRINIEESPTAATVLPVGSNYIGIGMFEKGRIHLYDQGGRYLDAGGKYPFDGEDMDANTRFLAYQSYLASNNDTKFVVASSYGDNIEFYRIEGKDSIILEKKHEKEDARFTIQDGILQLHDDCLLGYKGAWGQEKYCYLLFSGKTYAENNHKKHGANYMYVFTWDGKFIKSYYVENEILSFCVDEKNKIMYAIVTDEDEVVIKKFPL